MQEIPIFGYLCFTCKSYQYMQQFTSDAAQQLRTPLVEIHATAWLS